MVRRTPYPSGLGEKTKAEVVAAALAKRALDAEMAVPGTNETGALAILEAGQKAQMARAARAKAAAEERAREEEKKRKEEQEAAAEDEAKAAFLKKLAGVAALVGGVDTDAARSFCATEGRNADGTRREVRSIWNRFGDGY